jgi:chaperonin GroES
MDWEPLYDKIIVRRDRAAEVLKGLAVPDTAQKDQNSGTVLKVGIGRLDTTSSRVTKLLVRPGYRVLFGRFSGTPLDPDDPDTIVLREDELLAFEEPALPEPELLDAAVAAATESQT